MSIKNFIPEIWSESVQTALYGGQAFTSPNVITKPDPGEAILKYGDTFRINQIGKIANIAYTGGDITYPSLDDAQVVLHVDQRRIAPVTVEDLDAIQANVDLTQSIQDEISNSFMETAEGYIAGLYASASISSSATGVVGGAVVFADTTSQGYISAVAALLGDGKVPMQGRFMILPPWAYYRLKDGMGDAFTENVADLRSGIITGQVYGFTIYQSPYVNNDGTNWNIIAGTNKAIMMVEQVKFTQAMPDTKTLGELFRGVHLYGAKVVRPDQLFYGTIKKS